MSELSNRVTGRCYIIAEIGGNFVTAEEGVRLVKEAAACGVDAVKLQTYRPETLASRKAVFDMENTGKMSQYELFERYAIGEDVHARIVEEARVHGLDWFSTPSHETDLALLERLGAPAYKIGSDDATNLPFLDRVARAGKPVLLSTGMCTLSEVGEAVDTILGAGCRDLTLLHAVTSYPTHAEHVNLAAMTTMRRCFDPLPVGYSDHTIGTTACICAVAMGACVIEKHFTVDKGAEGPDHMLSADPSEMKAIVDAVRLFERMRGDGIKRPVEAEHTTRLNNRKSIVAARDVAAGERLKRADLAVKRPGYGIPPREIDRVVGRRAAVDLARDDVLAWDDLA